MHSTINEGGKYKMEVSAKYLKDEQNKIVSPIVSSETVMMGGYRNFR